MSKETQRLGVLLEEQTRVAQQAALEYAQKYSLSEEHRQAEIQRNRELCDGLAKAYQEHTESNCQQVVKYREHSMLINQELRGELNLCGQRYQQFETNASAQIQTLNNSASYWRAESEQEARSATLNSEQKQQASHRCMIAEQALRQSTLNLPRSQEELRVAVGIIEQEAMQHVQAIEQKTEHQLQESSRHEKLLNEEIHCRNFGLQLSRQKLVVSESETARFELLLAQRDAALQSANRGKSEYYETSVESQTK
jgi:hypothetical protein